MNAQAKPIAPRTPLPWAVNPECITTIKVGPTGAEMTAIPIVGGNTKVVGYILNNNDGEYIIKATQAASD